MSDQLAGVVSKAGHGANTEAREIREDRRGPWERAGAGFPHTHWGVIADMEAEADKLEQQIEELVDRDPEGAAKSEIGKMILQGYARLGILEGSSSEYPYRFSAADMVKDAMCIMAQLVAEEYFEEGPEACPLTPEAFLTWDFEKNHKRAKAWVDPFGTDERPNVTTEVISPGRHEIAHEAQHAPIEKPAHGFQELVG